jgi:hypothetical protein
MLLRTSLGVGPPKPSKGLGVVPLIEEIYIN